MLKRVGITTLLVVFGAIAPAFAETAAHKPTVDNPLMPKAAKPLSHVEAVRVVGRRETFGVYIAPMMMWPPSSAPLAQPTMSIPPPGGDGR